MKLYYNNIHPLGKMGLSALVAVFSLLLFMIGGAVIAVPIFGFDAFGKLLSSGMDYSPEGIRLLKYFQLVQSIGLFIAPAIFLASIFGDRIAKYLCLNKKPLIGSIVLSVVLIWTASPVINLLGIWNAGMTLPSWLSGIEQWMRTQEESAEVLTNMFLKTDSTGGLLFNILLIGVIPAIGEELLFRGIIQRLFTEWTKNKHLAIWITAILFSALHFQFFGFLPRALLGALFGYMLVWSNNLWLPVLAHFINNTTAVIAYHLFGKGVINVDPDTIGTQSENQIAAIVSLILLFLFGFLLKRNEEKNQLKFEA
jgi:uncharacterized protein